jgi:hypothetical protein
MKKRDLQFSAALLLLLFTLVACNGPSAPQLADVSGMVFLVSSASAVKPFAFGVELRQAQETSITGRIDEGSFPEFGFDNVKPGIYELWVLIPSYALAVSNCYDIGLPDSSWRLGRILAGHPTILADDTSYRDAFLKSLDSNQDTHDFYAILSDLEIKSGTNTKINIELICKGI